MILIDTSAWVEFLRATGSPANLAVRSALRADAAAITDAVSMEVLAGARSDRHLDELRGLLARATLLPTGPEDFDGAASLYRRCRRSGRTVRKMIDCLIASVAIRHDAPVLHADGDFDALAAVTELELART